LRDRRRRVLFDGAHAVRGAGCVPRYSRGDPLDRPCAGMVVSVRIPSPAAHPGGGRLMLALLLALQGAVSPPKALTDSLPQVTLVEALQRAAQLDPNYVAAIGLVDNAVWARRSAFSVFVLPAVSLETDATKNLPAFFNFGTLKPETYSVQASVSLRYDLFTGGQKVAELARSVEAVPLDSVLPAQLPLSLDAAVEEAAAQGPQYRIARANERAAAAAFRSQLGNYLPHASLTGTGIAFDNKFYPMGQRFSQLTLA